MLHGLKYDVAVYIMLYAYSTHMCNVKESDRLQGFGQSGGGFTRSGSKGRASKRDLVWYGSVTPNLGERPCILHIRGNLSSLGGFGRAHLFFLLHCMCPGRPCVICQPTAPLTHKTIWACKVIIEEQQKPGLLSSHIAFNVQLLFFWLGVFRGRPCPLHI